MAVMAGRRRWAEFPGEVPTAGLYAVFGAYLYCVSRILFLGFVHREAPQVFLTPVVLGRGLQFWISAGNLLWALYFAVRLLELATARERAKKTDALILLFAMAGLVFVETGMPVVFEVMADHMP
jgi:hypothetical protein